MCFLDVAKVFDKVPHKRQIEKLQKHGMLNIGFKIVRNIMDICNGLNNYYCNVGNKLVSH